MTVVLPITITGTISPQVNFPVLINLGVASGVGAIDTRAIFAEVGDAWQKIKITDQFGVRCYIEVVSWSADAKKAELHVLVPSISTGIALELSGSSSWDDDTTYIGITGSIPGRAVWDADFTGVYHMDTKTGSRIHDSTSHNNFGGKVGTIVDAAGVVCGNGQEFTGAGQIMCQVEKRHDDIATMEAWGYLHTASVDPRTLLAEVSGSLDTPQHEGGDGAPGMRGQPFQIGNFITSDAPSSAYILPLNEWVYLASVFNQTISPHSVGYFVNGELFDSVDWDRVCNTYMRNIGSRISDNNSSWFNPPNYVVDCFWDGVIDEVRYSKIGRTESWLSATNKSIRDILCTYGSTPPGPTADGFLWQISGLLALTNWSNPNKTPAPVDPVRVFPDAALEAAVRSAVGVPVGDIHQSDLSIIISFTASSLGIVDLTGMEYWTSLTTLILADNSIVDISPLAGLINLTTLALLRNSIVDISPLAGITSLTGLALSFNSIVDISALIGLTNLTMLGLNNNSIVDISDLVGLMASGAVNIEDNPLNVHAYAIDIPALQLAGISVLFDSEPTPTVTSITPNTGPSAGGTPVTIAGTGFLSGATVTIDGVPCTTVVFVSDIELTAVTPAGTAGAKDVVVKNDVETGTLAGGYEYT